jgi:hypothetical protein
MPARVKQFYVYGLIDPRTNLPFYIGKGSGNRVDQHEVEARAGKQSHKCNYIRELWREGCEVSKVTYKAFKSEKAAFKYEEALISEVGLDNLTNICAGGLTPILQDPELVRDKTMLDVFAIFVRKTAGFTQKRLWLFCQEWHELPDELFDMLKLRLREVIARRGFDWTASYLMRKKVTLVCATN